MKDCISIETEGDLKAGAALKLELIVQFDHDVHIDTLVLKHVIYRALNDFYRNKDGVIFDVGERLL